MSERLECTHWVQNIIHTGVLHTVHERTFEGIARLIDQTKDTKLSSHVANLMSIEYKMR